MLMAISPYHLTTREPPALVSLLLAEHAVTMIPTPFAGASLPAVEHAASRVPRYFAFMESWQWAMPLFREGVIASDWAGRSPTDDVHAACERIESDERLEELRPLMRLDLFDDEGRYLDAIAKDLLKGGPDPALTVPVAAGLDAFAARHRLVVARASASSVAQRAEDKLGRRLAAVAVPMLLQASAERLIEARELLEPGLGPLRRAVRELFASASAGADRHAEASSGPAPGSHFSGSAAEAQDRLREAAAVYQRRFDDVREELLEPEADEHAPRVVEGLATLTATALPHDAVLQSSLLALRSVAPVRGRGRGRTTRRAAAGSAGAFAHDAAGAKAPDQRRLPMAADLDPRARRGGAAADTGAATSTAEVAAEVIDVAEVAPFCSSLIIKVVGQRG